MPDPRPVYILDSFALLTYLQAEPGGATIRQLFEQARDQQAQVAMSLINLGETYYLMRREQNAERADAMLRDVRELPIRLFDATEERILAAARVKAQYPLSYADAFAIALTLELEGTLITGDPEFHKVESVIGVIWLPQELDSVTTVTEAQDEPEHSSEE